MLLFYDDSPVFGGHEVMALHAVAGLVGDPSTPPIGFFAHPKNTLLLKSLESIRAASPHRLHIGETPEPPRKPTALSSKFQRPQIRSLATRFRELRAHLLVAIQGDIAISALGLLAAKHAGIPTVSYIPVPHPLAEMGAKLGRLRDWLDTSLFRLPDAFITISHSMASKLARRMDGTKVIDIVYNGIDTGNFSPLPKSSSRECLGLPTGGTIIAQVGRIEFKQKRQDFLLESIAQSDLRDRVHLVFTGEGPDRLTLQSLAQSAGIAENVSFIPWQSEMSHVYSAADLLVIPSRFEGFPLVMLESIRCRTPVCASNRDGMADFLPSPWLFPNGDSPGLIDRIKAILVTDNKDHLDGLNRQIDSEMTLPAFQKNFAAALSHHYPRIASKSEESLTRRSELSSHLTVSAQTQA